MPGQKKDFSVKDVKGKPIPATIVPKPGWEKHFIREAGCIFQLPYENVAAIFVHKDLRSGNAAKVKAVVGKKHVAARVITCEDGEWEVRAEPIGDGRAGLTVYSKGGKALMAGTAEAEEDGSWVAKLTTLYPSISNQKHSTASASCTGTSGGGVSCTASVSTTW